MQYFFKTVAFLRRRRKNKEHTITCGINKQLYVGLQLSLENMVSLPTFIRMEMVSGGSRQHWLDTAAMA